MAAVLSSTYLGAGAAGIQLDNGDTRIYYQDADGAIYQIGGMGSPVSGTKYSPGLKALLVPADKVRVNTPLAVTAWGGFNEIRLYYIDRNNQIHELCYGFAGNFVPGALDNMNYKAAPNSGLLYAFSTPQGGRVGFQSADAPGVITEAQILQGGSWSTAKLA
ncbi:hypothetical protein MSAN_00127600 [Mycena sanguinolenta]|uniref:Fucose-specific lectin n=1 Tax=Mycena sanguinolenta TaxID=230812 RepID=A0A8H6ZKD2_9AGAR|nr:hypothetical protein MSAN_00127600 [Mycena sanguinolenta]